MNLQILNSKIASFAQQLDKDQISEILQLQAAQKQFSDHWNLETNDLRHMIEISFAKPLAYWCRSDYYPVKAMSEYATLNDDMVRSMFKDLFNENRNLTDRVNRFIDQCDELRRFQKLTKIDAPPHWHDKSIVMLYLAFRYPDTYLLMEESGFRKLLLELKAKPLGPILEIERYAKTSQIISKLIGKNQFFQDRIAELSDVMNEALSMDLDVVFHLYRYCTQKEQ